MRAVVELPATPPPKPPRSEERSGALPKTIAAAVAATAFLFAASSVFGDSPAWDWLGALVVAPTLFLLTVPILARQAKRESDRGLKTLLVVALVVKFAGSLVRYLIGENVYGGGVDATSYDIVGTELAEGFRAGDFSGIEGATGTHFIELLTGVVYTIIGPTIVGGFFFFSWLAFLGVFLFYRAFVIAVPEGRRRSYARLVFFLPSLLVWPSSIGKESWMIFALGIASFGAAKMLSGNTFRGLPAAGLGLWWAALPRAHIAGLAGVAIGVGMIFRRTRPELRQLGPIIKVASLAAVVVAGAFFVGRATSFVQEAGVETEGGFAGTLEEVADRTGGGKSSFQAEPLTSPGQAPMAAFTVLFRPTLADARSATALLAAGEGTFLVLFALKRLRWILAAARLVRRRPYVAFAIAMVGALIVAFSAISNLGILARERVQLLPFFFVLLSVPSKRWLALQEERARRSDERERARAAVAVP